MKEKKWRLGVLEKMEGGKPVSASGPAKPAVTPSDMYRDANNALGMMFKTLCGFFGIKVPGPSNSRGKSRQKKKSKGGWF